MFLNYVVTLKIKEQYVEKLNILSRPVFKRCSPKSQPNTLSFKIPLCFNFLREGRERRNDRKNAINFPCLRKTTKQKQLLA